MQMSESTVAAPAILRAPTLPCGKASALGYGETTIRLKPFPITG